MLDKTKVRFQSDMKDFYIHYTRMNRLKNVVMGFFRDFVFVDNIDKMGFEI